MVAARAAWDSEGGATGDNEPLSNGPGGRAPVNGSTLCRGGAAGCPGGPEAGGG